MRFISEFFGTSGILIVLVIASLLFGIPRILKNRSNRNFLKQLLAYLDNGEASQREYISENIGHLIQTLGRKNAGLALEQLAVGLPREFNILKSYPLSPNELLVIVLYRLAEASGLDSRTSTHEIPKAFYLKIANEGGSIEVYGEFPNDLNEKIINSQFAEYVATRA